MVGNEQLPTIGEALANWLGVQLPSIPLPQTLKNLDKAIAKVVLASGENIEARIRKNTSRTEAKGTIEIEGMFRTEEERRKLENKLSTTRAAIEEIEANSNSEDAKAEIDDDWLNLFARLSEDKSSEDLRRLFGKVLAGEIKRPGSFSLRTIQLLATTSKQDLDLISKFLGYAINDALVPFKDAVHREIRDIDRLAMEELRIAGHPARIGGMTQNLDVKPRQSHLVRASGTLGVIVGNATDVSIKFRIEGQALTSSARELIPIANSPPAGKDFVQELARDIYNQIRGADRAREMDDGQITVVIANYFPAGDNIWNYQIIEMLSNT
jgi:hypothetical protein